MTKMRKYVQDIETNAPELVRQLHKEDLQKSIRRDQEQALQLKEELFQALPKEKHYLVEQLWLAVVSFGRDQTELEYVKKETDYGR